MRSSKRLVTFFPMPMVGILARTPRWQAKPKPVKESYLLYVMQCIKRNEDSMEKEGEKLASRMKQTIAINKQ